MDNASLVRRPLMPEDDHRAAGTGLSAADVRDYLLRTPRQLPSRYFYDALGSALFDAICELPWYGIPRAESSLLARHAAAILPSSGGVSRLVELGPGSGAKLATLIAAAPHGGRHVSVHLVDVSASALETARRTVAASGAANVTLHERSYEEGLREALASRIDGSTLILFLGSNLGNFDRPAADALLGQIRAAMSDGDGLLIGADLVKPEPALRLAYDDPIGVTAAFNRNLLHRVNRELGADFRLNRFAHRAAWNAEQSRIEMHLVSLERQVVRVRGARLSFTMEEGDYIWTESSYKYTPADLQARVRAAGFRVAEQWLDDRDGFALTLARVGAGRTRLLRRAGPSSAIGATARARRRP